MLNYLKVLEQRNFKIQKLFLRRNFLHIHFMHRTVQLTKGNTLCNNYNASQGKFNFARNKMRITVEDQDS